MNVISFGGEEGEDLRLLNDSTQLELISKLFFFFAPKKFFIILETENAAEID